VDDSISIISVLRRTFASYRDQAVVLLSLAALAVVPIEVLGALLGKASPAAALVVLVVDIVAIALFTGTVVQLAADSRGNAPAKSPGELLRAVRPVLGQLVLVGIVAGLALGLLSFVGSLLFAGVIVGTAFAVGSIVEVVIVGLLLGVVVSVGPSLFLITIWSVAAPVVVLERPGGLLALPRSHQLVRGNRRRVCVAVLALAIPLGVAGGAIEGGGQALGSVPSTLAELLIPILIAPIPALASAALYLELRGGSPAAAQPGPPKGVPSQPLSPAPSQLAAPTPPRA
jgi:hypothetical protein